MFCPLVGVKKIRQHVGLSVLLKDTSVKKPGRLLKS